MIVVPVSLPSGESVETVADFILGKFLAIIFSNNVSAPLTAAERRYPMSKVRSSSHEEIPHIQGKRNPSKMVGVARGHQRADTLKP